MHYFLFACLDQFYARTLTEAEPGLAQRPLVIHRDKRVIDINPAAQSLGVQPGIALSEAKAIAHGGAFVAWEEEPYRKAQTQWLDLALRYCDRIEPEEQHTAYLDLSDHPTPDQIADMLTEDLHQQGWQTRTGNAHTKWIAKVCALANIHASGLRTLKTAYLLPVPPEHRQRLNFLGYRTIGQVSTVPLDVLRKQFGEEGLLIHQAAWGGVQQDVQPSYPKDATTARVTFDGGVEDRDSFEYGLHQLARDLANRLVEKDWQGEELRLTIEYEDEQDFLQRTFTKPLQSQVTVLTALKLALEGKLRPEPVFRIRALMPNLIKARRTQRELTGAASAAERDKGLEIAFRNLRQVFGDSTVQKASETKEPRRKAVLRAWKDVTGWA